MWLLIIVVIVLLLRAMQTSKSAATISQKCSPACNAPKAGDCFKSGNAPVAGVPERGYPMPAPAQQRCFGLGIHCNHILYQGLPLEVTFPVAPPPLAILKPAPTPVVPVRSYPRPVGPISRPIANCIGPIGPMCCYGGSSPAFGGSIVCGEGGGSGRFVL